MFETANGRANTLQRLGENLQQVHNVLSGWQGEAGEAFRTDLGKTRRDIEADGQESRQVTGDPTWDALTHGLGKSGAADLAWQVNERFLRGQLEMGVSRIEYKLPPGFGSVEELLERDPRSFSAREIAFVKSNAEAYGYRQVGDSWVRVTGGWR